MPGIWTIEMGRGRHREGGKRLRGVRCDDTGRADPQIIQLSYYLAISADRSLSATHFSSEYNMLAHQLCENEDPRQCGPGLTQTPVCGDRYPVDSVSHRDREQNPGWQQVPGANKIRETIQCVYAQGRDYRD